MENRLIGCQLMVVNLSPECEKVNLTATNNVTTQLLEIPIKHGFIA